MTRSKKLTVFLLVVGGVLLAVVGTCGVMMARGLGDPKGPTAVDWNGDAAPNDEQAAALGRKLLAGHGRDVSSSLEVDRVQRREDGSLEVYFLDRQTAWWWFAEFKREGGKWVGYSRHGT